MTLLPADDPSCVRLRIVPLLLMASLSLSSPAWGAPSVMEAPVLPPLVEGDRIGPAWVFQGLPQQTLPRTRYEVAAHEGRPVLQVVAEGSYGHLVHTPATPLPAAGLAWRWQLDQGNAEANVRQRQGDDNPIKVCVSFALPPERVPFVERQLLRLAQARTGQPLPPATLCYVWDLREAPGTVLDNAYTRRVRLWVLRSGVASPGGAWPQERRDLAADFAVAFGDEWPPGAGPVPPVTAVWVSGDADNTGGRSRARIADLQWIGAGGAAR